MATKKPANIRPQQNNANAHTPRGMGMLEGSIQRDGWIGAITVAADGETFDGSARVEVTAANGMLDDAIVVETDGTRPIVVKRTDIATADDPRAKRLSVAANRVAELNLAWEPGVLAEMRDDPEVALGALFTPAEMADLAQPAETSAPGAGGDEFDATPDDGPTRAQLGDLWQIGPHRLLVGDCTDAANVARLMGGERADMVFTDPPYGVDYVGKTKDALVIDNDNLGDDGTRELVRDIMTVAPLREGGSFYVCSPAGNTETAFRLALREAKLELRQCIVWVKQHFVMGRQDYHWRHESILYGWKAGAGHYFVDDRTQDTVWEIDRPAVNADHPTMKPIGLVEKAIRNNSRASEIVYDGCLGSGTTLIAAHRTGRRCYGCELSPRYADVILRRAEAEGLTVKRADQSHTM